MRSGTRVKLRRQCRRGLGLVEMLISLSIAAALLTATAVALDGSCIAYRVNEEQSSLIQRTRLTLNRITTSIRTTTLHAPHTPALATSFAGGFIVTDTGLDMLDATGTQITFRYDAPNLRVLAIAGAVQHVLAEGVTSFQLTLEPMHSAESVRTGSPCDLLRRATILMSIQTAADTARSSETTGKQIITLSASVMPRRNTW